MRVMGCGPAPCKFLFIGERPGRQEMEKGLPFVGKTGKELTRLLWTFLGLTRADVYLDNLVKDRLGDKDKPPTHEEIMRDEPDLLAMLDRVRPDIIVTLGLHATRYFLGPEATMEKDHAIPRHVVWRPINLSRPGRLLTVMPIYHPAAAMHVPELQPLVAYGFQQLGLYIKGLLPEPTVDDFEGNEIYKIGDDNDLDILEETLRANPEIEINVAVDTEGLKDSEWGLSLSYIPGTSLVFKVGTSPSLHFSRLDRILQNRRIILHNSLHDLGILARLGIHVENFVDTMIMAYLLQIEPQGLKPLSHRHSGMKMSDYTDVVNPYAQRMFADYIDTSYTAALNDLDAIQAHKDSGSRKHSLPKRLGRLLKDYNDGKCTDLDKRYAKFSDEFKEKMEEYAGPFPEPGLVNVPDEKAIPYSARDADATLRLYPILQKKIDAMELNRILALDLSVVPMIDRMQEVGFAIDVPRLGELGSRLTSEMANYKLQAKSITGLPDFNVGSDPQMATYLYDFLGCKPPKLTKGKTRGSVDDKALEELKMTYYDHDLVLALIDCRNEFKERQKLNGTYVRNIDKFIWPEDQRIHAHFRITRVVSGRLATFDPNILAIPVRTQLGRLIRGVFIAPKGRRLGSWDLDQIEMRVLAHESGDPGMIEVLSDPTRHIHKETTFRIYGIPVAEVDKESTEYMMSKNISFGIVYGITAEGLRAQMAQRGQKRTLEECQALIDLYLTKAYPMVLDYIERERSNAIRYGFVRSMMGRIRYLPGIRSNIPAVQSEAERAAGNFVIQAGASDIVKLWMARVWERIKDGMAEPLLQVHDELILEFNEGDEELLDWTMKDALREAVEPLGLKVPVKCGGNFGMSWKELK